MVNLARDFLSFRLAPIANGAAGIKGSLLLQMKRGWTRGLMDPVERSSEKKTKRKKKKGAYGVIRDLPGTTPTRPGADAIVDDLYRRRRPEDVLIRGLDSRSTMRFFGSRVGDYTHFGTIGISSDLGGRQVIRSCQGTPIAPHFTFFSLAREGEGWFHAVCKRAMGTPRLHLTDEIRKNVVDKNSSRVCIVRQGSTTRV